MNIRKLKNMIMRAEGIDKPETDAFAAGDIIKVFYCLLKAIGGVKISRKTLDSLPEDWAEKIVIEKTGDSWLISVKDKQSGIITPPKILIV